MTTVIMNPQFVVRVEPARLSPRPPQPRPTISRQRIIAALREEDCRGGGGERQENTYYSIADTAAANIYQTLRRDNNNNNDNNKNKVLIFGLDSIGLFTPSLLRPVLPVLCWSPTCWPPTRTR